MASETARVNDEGGGWDDLREVIDRACIAVSKGDAPDAVAAYIWSNIGPRLSEHEAAVEERVWEGLVKEIRDEWFDHWMEREEQFADLRRLAADFLEFSQRIERSGDAEAMEEYEGTWHELTDLLASLDSKGEEGR